MTRFIRQGKAKYYFLPTVAAYTTGGAPTSAERTAGTDMTKKIATVSGWMKEGSRVDTPDMSADFIKNIPGTKSVGDSGFGMYADDTTDPVRTVLSEDVTGYVWIEKGTTKGDLFPVRVLNVGDEHSVGNEPARYNVAFAITDVPNIELTVP